MTQSSAVAPIISVKNVSRSFRSVKKTAGWKGAFNLLLKPEHVEHFALKNISFEIEPGAFVGLIGANGAGKTTLLKILSGLIPASSGNANVMGFDPFTRSLEYRKKIALVMGQKAQLWWDLPALDAFDLIKAIYEIPPKVYQERLTHLSELLDVTRLLQTQIRRLSLGERMKMELIGAILHWPKVIFLDEPTIGLDILAAHRLREFLRVFNHKEKSTIILTSHNMDDIELLCPRVVILKSGENIYDGQSSGLTRPDERRLKVRFTEDPGSEKVLSVSGIDPKLLESPVLPLETNGGAKEDADEVPPDLSYVFNIKQDQIGPILHSLLGQFKVADMGIEEQSLERVIQRIYEGGPAQ